MNGIVRLSAVRNVGHDRRGSRMTCNSCGATDVAGDFCNKCGARLAQAPSAASEEKPASTGSEKKPSGTASRLPLLILLGTVGSCGLCGLAAIFGGSGEDEVRNTAPAAAPPTEKQEDVAAYVLSVLPPLDACEKECILSSTAKSGFSSSDFSACMEMLRAAPQGLCDEQLPKSAHMFAGVWKTRAAVDKLAKTFPREAPDPVLIGMAAYCDKAVAHAEAQVAHLNCARQWNSGGCTTDRMNELNSIAMSLKVGSEAMLRDLQQQAVPHTGTPADRAAATKTLDKIGAAFSKCMRERVQPIFNTASPQVIEVRP